jgi:hypothetical protein
MRTVAIRLAVLALVTVAFVPLAAVILLSGQSRPAAASPPAAAAPKEPTLRIGSFIYAVDESGQLRQYRLDAHGERAPLAPELVPVHGEPGGIASVSPPGGTQAVYVLEIDFATVAQFRVAADGTLHPLSPARVDAHSHPTGIAFHALPGPGSGRRLFAYVSCSHGALCQYRVGRDGRLVALDPPCIYIDTDPSAPDFEDGGRRASVRTPVWTEDGARAGERVWHVAVRPDGTLKPLPAGSSVQGTRP